MAIFTSSIAQSRVDRFGRITIPASLREALGLQPGEPLLIRVEEGELRISSLRNEIHRFRGIARAEGDTRSAVDELIAERRAEAASE